MPKSCEKHDKKDDDSWLPSLSVITSFFYRSSVHPAPTQDDKVQQMSQSEFHDIQQKALSLKTSLTNLHQTYKSEEAKLRKGPCGFLRRLPGCNWRADRTHTINFIVSVNAFLRADFNFSDNQQQLIHLKAMQGLACYGSLLVASQYHASDPNGGIGNNGSGLYKVLGPKVSQLSQKEQAVALASLKRFMTTHDASHFTYKSGKTRQDYYDKIDEMITELDPSVALTFSTS